MQLPQGTFLGNYQGSQIVDGVIISQASYTQKVFEGWHSHENPHLSLILTGGNLESRKGQEVQVDAIKVMCYNSDELHKNTQTRHPSRNMNIELLERFFVQYDLNRTSFSKAYSQQPQVKFAMLKILKECELNDELSLISIGELLLNIWQDLLPSQPNSFKPSWLKKVKELLHDRWNENLSLQEMASVCEVHPVHLSKYFSKYEGTTIGNYVRKIRVDKSLQLIQQKESTLTEIGIDCGFYDQSHFIKNFKECTGFLPKEISRL